MTKKVLITGANRGLGLALCAYWLAEGWEVFAAAHQHGRTFPSSSQPAPGKAPSSTKVPVADQVPATLPGDNSAPPDLSSLAHHASLHTLALELGDDRSVRDFSKELHRLTDSLDMVINNAAVLGDTSKKAGEGIDYEDAAWVHNINVLGTLRVTDAVLDLVMASPTRLVVDISSEAGSIGQADRDGWYAYCMSKAALNMQGRLLHNHIRPSGGRVLLLHPGWVRTWMQGHLDAGADLSPHQSAEGLGQRIKDYLALKDIPAAPPYLDWKGDPLPW